MKPSAERRLHKDSLLVETVESDDELSDSLSTDSSVSNETKTTTDKADHVPSESNADSTGFIMELKIISKMIILIGIQCVFELTTATIVTIMVGNYHNDDKYLSGVGIGGSFTNVSAVGICWGFTSALYTLFPQALGHHDVGESTFALRVHLQRALCLTTLIGLPLFALQFYAGKLMVAIGAAPSSLEPIIRNYAITQIPFIFINTYLSILQRLCQAYEFNYMLSVVTVIGFILTFPVLYIFIYAFGWGYVGAGVGKTLIFFLLFVMILLYLLRARNVSMELFKPLSLKIIFNFEGVKEYVSLSLPGLLQGTLQWSMIEMVVLMSGFVGENDENKNTMAIASAIIVYNIYLVSVSFALGISNGVSVRTGKYIGFGSEVLAKRAAKAGFVVAVTLFCVLGLMLGVFANDIPKIWTDNDRTASLASKLCYVYIVFQALLYLSNAFGGLYRALGKPKVQAILMLSGSGFGAVVLCVLFFVFDLRKGLLLGCALAWVCMGFGHVVTVVVSSFHVKYSVKWRSALHESQRRLKQTLSQASLQSIQLAETPVTDVVPIENQSPETPADDIRELQPTDILR